MLHTSVPIPGAPIEILDLTPVNQFISKCAIKVCYVSDDLNRNGSVITKETATQIANTIPGSPIVGKYIEEKTDFNEHDRKIEVKDGQFVISDDTRPYGFVDLGAKVWFQKFLDDNEVEREYLVTEGYLWTGQYPECQRVLDQGNNQSMELDEDSLKGTWAKDDNGKPTFFIINEAMMYKLCILGQENEPCFEGAQITRAEFSFEPDFKNKLFNFLGQMKDILQEGGHEMQDEEKLETAAEPQVSAEEQPIEQEPVQEEPVVNEEPINEEPAVNEEPIVNEEPVAEGEPEPAAQVSYVLDEIPEYVELLNQHNDVVAQFNAVTEQLQNLQTAYDTLKSTSEATINALSEFKCGVEREKKKKMINSFYMLSDEDKQDVLDNIDTYSLDDIEAKLSVICVRKKVNFSVEEPASTGVTTYNLQENSEAALMPDWVKAAMEVAKTMN